MRKVYKVPNYLLCIKMALWQKKLCYKEHALKDTENLITYFEGAKIINNTAANCIHSLSCFKFVLVFRRFLSISCN